MADDKIIIELSLDGDEASVDKAVGDLVKGLKSKLPKEGKSTGGLFGRSFKKAAGANIGGVAKTVAKSIAAASAAITGFAVVAVAAAAREQDAINGLNAALAASGQFSEEASQDLQNFANQLQKTTVFGNEAVLEQLAFAQSMGATADQSKVVVTAAADMAAALNMDLNQATRNAAKTLGGYAGELGEVIPELKNLTAEQLRAGAGVDLLAAKFAGMAAAQATTFSGGIKQLSNVFGDFLERVGEIITKSPLAVAIINKLTVIFSTLAAKVKSMTDAGDPFRTFIKGAIDFGNVMNKFVVLPLELAFNTARTVFTGITSFMKAQFAGMVTIAKKANDILASVGIDTGLDQMLTDMADSATQVADEGFADFRETMKKNLDFPAAMNVEKGLEDLNRFADESEAPLSKIATNFGNASGKVEKTMKKTVADVANAVKNSLAGGLVTATQMMVNALMRGGVSIKDFGKLFLSVIGDMATNVGKTLILTGIGIESLKTLGGAAAIAAGIGLVAVGQIIKNLSGGGGAAATGADAGGGGVGAAGITAESTEETAIDQDEEERVPQTVNINIEGDVLGDESAGTRILELINSAADAEGAILNVR